MGHMEYQTEGMVMQRNMCNQVSDKVPAIIINEFPTLQNKGGGGELSYI